MVTPNGITIGPRYRSIYILLQDYILSQDLYIPGDYIVPKNLCISHFTSDCSVYRNDEVFISSNTLCNFFNRMNNFAISNSRVLDMNNFRSIICDKFIDLEEMKIMYQYLIFINIGVIGITQEKIKGITNTLGEMGIEHNIKYNRCTIGTNNISDIHNIYVFVSKYYVSPNMHINVFFEVAEASYKQ